MRQFLIKMLVLLFMPLVGSWISSLKIKTLWLLCVDLYLQLAELRLGFNCAGVIPSFLQSILSHPVNQLRLFCFQWHKKLHDSIVGVIYEFWLEFRVGTVVKLNRSCDLRWFRTPLKTKARLASFLALQLFYLHFWYFLYFGLASICTFHRQLVLEYRINFCLLRKGIIIYL